MAFGLCQHFTNALSHAKLMMSSIKALADERVFFGE